MPTFLERGHQVCKSESFSMNRLGPWTWFVFLSHDYVTRPEERAKPRSCPLQNRHEMPRLRITSIWVIVLGVPLLPKQSEHTPLLPSHEELWSSSSFLANWQLYKMKSATALREPSPSSARAKMAKTSARSLRPPL